MKEGKSGWLIALIIIILIIIGVVALGGDSNEGNNTNEVESEVIDPIALVDGDYEANTESSDVHWEGAKTIIVDWSHNGTVGVKSGNLQVDGGMVVGGEVVVDMTSIAVDGHGSAAAIDNDGLISHFESEDWFDVANYPEATLVIKGSQPLGGNDFQVTADLTIKGTTKEISFPATISTADGMFSAMADITIDRTEFDVQFGSGKFFEDLGDNAINDEFDLELHLEAEMANGDDEMMEEEVTEE